MEPWGRRTRSWATWDKREPRRRHAQAAPPPPAAPRASRGPHVGKFTTATSSLASPTQPLVDQGNKIFHDAKAMGGTIAVSCDMCHPNGANTHPETYPKFQVQLSRSRCSGT